MSAVSMPVPGAVRALRLELKRNAVPYLLPLLAAVFFFNTVRTADGLTPVWTNRASVIGDHMLFEFSAFAGGLAAWAGSREGRRKTADLVATTSRAAWGRLSIALAGTLGWLLFAFLAGVAYVYVKTALQATWGGPPLWPVFVGAAGVIVVSVIGFICGVLFPGRFTAPLVAVGTLLLYQAGFRQALAVSPGSGSTTALLSPANALPVVDSGVYSRVPPDLSIVQVMFMGGIAVALFGALGLIPELRRLAAAGSRASRRAVLARDGSWLVRGAAIVLIACGAAAATTGFSLAGTAKPTAAGGWEIPALHSAASDRPVAAAQDCTSGAALKVCVHPAFSFYLSYVATALKPVAADIAGLPGTPVKATEVASISGGQPVMSGMSGNPPVFDFTAEHAGPMFGEFNGMPDPTFWRANFQLALLDAFLASGPQLGPAQQAVENALLSAVGTTPADVGGQQILNGQPSNGTSPAISAAAHRFLRLSASERHAWLAAHLSALRAGAITLAQIP